jgi:lipid-binding SYLF domain-containing protein
MRWCVSVALLALSACAATLPRPAEIEKPNALVDGARATLSVFASGHTSSLLMPTLGKAKAILIFPHVIAGGLLLAGTGGDGVLLVRDASTGHWVGPAFYALREASFGAQAGIESAQVVMIVESQRALDRLYSSKLKLGIDASLAIGGGGGAGGGINEDIDVYSIVKGVFVGIALDGSALYFKESLNTDFYGVATTPAEIFMMRSVTNPASDRLTADIERLTN